MEIESEDHLWVLVKILGKALTSKEYHQDSTDYQTIQFLHAAISEELKEVLWRKYLKEKEVL